jgi:hypothetical protein
MADPSRPLSDGTKPPTLPRWLVGLMVILLLAAMAGTAWVIAYVVGFFKEASR